MTSDGQQIYNNTYLRGQQYRDDRNLSARARLHAKYGRGDWFGWVASHHDWQAVRRVVDVGCGPGWFWVQTADRLPELLEPVLIDASAGMVGEGITRVRGLERWGRVCGAVGDAMALPLPDGSMDAVLCLHMLYHLPSPMRGIAELARVLRPGGTALIALNGAANLMELRDIRREAFGQIADVHWPGQFGIESAEPLLCDVFSQVEFLRFDDGLVCTEPVDLVDYVLSMPPGDGASVEEVAQLRAVVDKRFAAAGGSLSITKDVGLFRCVA